jgi:hypothetical protein
MHKEKKVFLLKKKKETATLIESYVYFVIINLDFVLYIIIVIIIT